MKVENIDDAVAQFSKRVMAELDFFKDGGATMHPKHYRESISPLFKQNLFSLKYVSDEILGEPLPAPRNDSYPFEFNVHVPLEMYEGVEKKVIPAYSRYKRSRKKGRLPVVMRLHVSDSKISEYH